MSGGGGGYWQKAIQSFGVTMGALAKQKGAGAAFDARNKGAINAAKEINSASGKVEDLYSPYTDLSNSLVPQLEASASRMSQPVSLARGSDFLPDYYNSPEYKLLNAQATDQILRNASATGGVRNGNTNASLMNSAPTLGLQALDRENALRVNENQLNTDRFNNLYNATNLGYSGVNQAAGNYGRTGAALAGLKQYQGESQAAYKTGKFNAQGQMHEDLASIWGS